MKRNTPEYRKAYYLANKEAFRERRRAHQLAHPEKYNNKELIFERYKRGLSKKYGFTPEQIEALYSIAICEICTSLLEDKKKRHFDHCHVTGKFRGVICNNCNHLLGHAHDSVETLTRAIVYLKKHK